ncbi:MAG: hypothetical protein AAFN43_02095 [Pseudomonadota bacterium]
MKTFKTIACPLAIMSMFAISGCQNYETRHDGVTIDAGNHLAANEAQMVADPWKRNAYNTHTHADGKRSADIVKKYRNEHHVKEEAAAPVGAMPGLPVAPPSQTN